MDSRRRGLLVLTALAAALAAGAAPALALEGYGQAVDGDGLYVEGREIRLHGIDAPEWDQVCMQPGDDKWMAGREATAALRSLLASGPVTCHDTGARSYKRIVAVCYLRGADLAAIMVRLGWAFDAPRYSRGRYAAAEAVARETGRGIWAGHCDKPWEWRRR